MLIFSRVVVAIMSEGVDLSGQFDMKPKKSRLMGVWRWRSKKNSKI